MREIEFRAWDEEKNVWHYFKLDGCKDFDRTSEKLCDLNSDWFQFTGLKDKNGKEIYEGDIIQTKLDGLIWRYEIKSLKDFGNNLYKVTRYRNFEHNENGDGVMGDFYVNEGRGELIGIKECEVIGNIYENPELKETKK